MVKLWMSWCRLCAREDPGSSHINALLENDEDFPLTDRINQYFSVDINNFNNLPKMICSDCYKVIRTIVSLNKKIVKVSAMFDELQVTDEDRLDIVHLIKARHNLESNFTHFAISSLEKSDAPAIKLNSETDEQMIECDTFTERNETLLPNPINIEAEEQYEQKYVPLEKTHEEIPPISIEVEEHFENKYVPPEKSHEQKPSKAKRKYKRKQEKQAENQAMPYCCSTCCKGFLKLFNYRRHMQIVHDVTIDFKPRRFICEHCDKEYKTISALKEHERSHTNERTFKCRYCDKAFKGLPTQKIHEQTHNETKYVCVVCGIKLSTKQTLRMHMVVHSDQKKYKCDDCGSEFKRAKALKNHLILHTGLKPYACDFCSRTFASGANCRSHKKKNHPIELAAQEAAGNINISKRKIPSLKELKAVTANKGHFSKLNKRFQEFEKVVSLKPISVHDSFLPLKSGVFPADELQRPFDTPSLE